MGAPTFAQVSVARIATESSTRRSSSHGAPWRRPSVRPATRRPRPSSPRPSMGEHGTRSRARGCSSGPRRPCGTPPAAPVTRSGGPALPRRADAANRATVATGTTPPWPASPRPAPPATTARIAPSTRRGPARLMGCAGARLGTRPRPPVRRATSAARPATRIWASSRWARAVRARSSRASRPRPPRPASRGPTSRAGAPRPSRSADAVTPKTRPSAAWRWRTRSSAKPTGPWPRARSSCGGCLPMATCAPCPRTAARTR